MTDTLRRAERYRNAVVVLVLMAWPFARHTHRVCREVPDAIIPGCATATRHQGKILVATDIQLLANVQLLVVLPARPILSMKPRTTM